MNGDRPPINRRMFFLLAIVVVVVVMTLWQWYEDGGWPRVISGLIVFPACFYGGWRFLRWVEKGDKS